MTFKKLRVLFSKRKESILDVMDRHRREVLSREQGAVNAMLEAFGLIRDFLDVRLREITRLIAVAQEEAEDPGTWLYEQYRYRAFLEDLGKEIDKFSAHAEGITKDSQAASAALGTAHAQELMVLEVKVKRVFTQLPKAAIEQMVGALRDGSPLRTLFEDISPKAAEAAHEIFVTAIGSGEGPRQTAKRLADSIEEMTYRRAVRIARNESLRVLTTAQARNYELNADVVDGVRIVSALDSRTCPLCWARHGTILKHGELFHRHICCRCALAPVTAYSKKWASGEQEFALLTEDKQKEILKGRRYELWKSGQIQFNDLYNLTTHSQWGPQISLKPIKKLSKLKKAPGTYTAPAIGDGTSSVVNARQREGITAK